MRNCPPEHHLSGADPVMGRLIAQVGPCRLKPRPRPPFAALVQSVIYQQLNGTAASTILGRFRNLFGTRKFPNAKEVLSIPESSLRAAGLSRAKVAAIRDIAAKTVEGLVPSTRVVKRLSDEEIVSRLALLRGVGPWTVEMFLIFTLGRPDVLPVSDYGVRKGFARTYGFTVLPTPRELLTAGERWRPFRSTAAWYLWRSLELP